MAMLYEDDRFEDVTVTLDGNTYRNCTFNNVLLNYSGGPVEMERCSIQRFQIQFGGDLAQGLNTLYQLFGTEGMLQILRGFTEPSAGEVELPG